MGRPKQATHARGAALITGASRGIGMELARLAAADGHDLVLVARTEAALEELAAELREQHGVCTTTIAADLLEREGVDRVIAGVGNVDLEVVVGNAGIGGLGAFHTADLDHLQRIVDLNITALMRLTHALLPGLVARGGGRILQVSSIAGFEPGPGMATYHASKAFVTSHALAIGHELKGTGVTVTALCPGPVATGFSEAAGIPPSKLQAATELDAQRVARDGWRAMRRGRPLVVPGIAARLASMSRVLPLRLVVPVTGRTIAASTGATHG